METVQYSVTFFKALLHGIRVALNLEPFFPTSEAIPFWVELCVQGIWRFSPLTGENRYCSPPYMRIRRCYLYSFCLMCSWASSGLFLFVCLFFFFFFACMHVLITTTAKHSKGTSWDLQNFLSTHLLLFWYCVLRPLPASACPDSHLRLLHSWRLPCSTRLPSPCAAVWKFGTVSWGVIGLTLFVFLFSGTTVPHWLGPKSENCYFRQRGQVQSLLLHLWPERECLFPSSNGFQFNYNLWDDIGSISSTSYFPTLFSHIHILFPPQICLWPFPLLQPKCCFLLRALITMMPLSSAIYLTPLTHSTCPYRNSSHLFCCFSVSFPFCLFAL